MESLIEQHKLTVPQLKDELRKRGAKLSGNKAELEERLKYLLRGETPPLEVPSFFPEQIQPNLYIIRASLLKLEPSDLFNACFLDENYRFICEDPSFWAEYYSLRNRSFRLYIPLSIAQYYLDDINHLNEAEKWMNYLAIADFIETGDVTEKGIKIRQFKELKKEWFEEIFKLDYQTYILYAIDQLINEANKNFIFNLSTPTSIYLEAPYGEDDFFSEFIDLDKSQMKTLIAQLISANIRFYHPQHGFELTLEEIFGLED